MAHPCGCRSSLIPYVGIEPSPLIVCDPAPPCHQWPVLEFRQPLRSTRPKRLVSAKKTHWRQLRPTVSGLVWLVRQTFVGTSKSGSVDTFALKLRGVLAGMIARGMPQRTMINELNGLGVKTSLGGTWSLIQLQRTLARIAVLN